MAENAFTQNGALSSEERAALAKSDSKIVSGARWFWWIAGLSLINTILIHSGSDTSFVIGLGFTLLADAIFQTIKPIAFGIDAVALGFFFAMGWFALRGHVWAFIVGIVFYACDAGIYLFGGDWMPVAFHALALYYLIRATVTLRATLKSAASVPVEPPPLPQSTSGT